MAYEVSCNHCGARFSLTDDLYARKVKGRIATIRCRRCARDLVVDDATQAGVAANLKPMSGAPPAPTDEPTSEQRISEARIPSAEPAVSDQEPETPKVRTPMPTAPSADALTSPRAASTVRLPGAKAGKPEPPPVPRKTPMKAVKALWVVSYAEADDRELTALQIRSALVRGEINRDTILWQEGMPEWLPLWRVPELAPLVPKQGEVLLHKMPPERSPRRPISTPPPKPATATPLPKGLVNAPGRPPMRSAPELSPDTATAPEERAKTRPDLPRAKALAKEPAPAAPPAQVDEAPPSSGAPALRALTQREPERNNEPDDFFLGMRTADPGLLSPPMIDVSELVNGPATGPDAAPARSEPRLPAARTKPGIAPPRTEPVRSRATETPLPAQRRPPPPRVAMPSEPEREPALPLVAKPIARAPVEPVVVAASPPPSQLVDSEPPNELVARPNDSSEPPALPTQRRSPVLWLALLGVALVVGFFMLFRTPRTRPAAEAAASSAPVAAAPVVESAAAEPPKTEPLPVLAPTEASHAESATPPDPIAQPGSVHPSAPAISPLGEHKTPRTERPAEPAPTRASEKPEPSPEPSPSAAATARAETKPSEPAEPATEPFSKSAAVAALNSAAAAASACRQDGDPSGVAAVVITFASSGRVTSATIGGPPFAGTATGGCIARTLRKVHVPPFVGDHVTVSKSVVIQ